jgi:hypothetical protein
MIALAEGAAPRKAPTEIAPKLIVYNLLGG